MNPTPVPEGQPAPKKRNRMSAATKALLHDTLIEKRLALEREIEEIDKAIESLE